LDIVKFYNSKVTYPIPPSDIKCLNGRLIHTVHVILSTCVYNTPSVTSYQMQGILPFITNPPYAI